MKSKINWPNTKLCPIVNVVVVRCQSIVSIFKDTIIIYGQISLKGVASFITLYYIAPLEPKQASALITAGKKNSVMMVIHTSITFFYRIHPSSTARLYTV